MHSTTFSAAKVPGRTDCSVRNWLELRRAVKAGFHGADSCRAGWGPEDGTCSEKPNNWVCSAWRRESLWGRLTAAHKSLIGGWREDVVTLLGGVQQWGERQQTQTGT